MGTKVRPTAGKGKTDELQMGLRYSVLLVLCVLLSVCLFGCGDKFWDPTQVGRFRPVPALNVILPSLGVAEETLSAWEGAEEPRPIDVVMPETDHIFGAGDIVRVSVFELFREGERFVDDYPVRETGKISIPDVGEISAAGLTESQLEQEIRDILKPGKLKEPSVAVTLVRSERRTFSILGNGVSTPSRYFVPRYDFRLADAIATAGGISEFNVHYIYVSRAVTGKEAEPAPAEPGAGLREGGGELLKVPEDEMIEIISPIARVQRPDRDMVVASAEMVTDNERGLLELTRSLEGLGGRAGGGDASEGLARDSERLSGAETSGASEGEGRIEWVFQDGRWVPVQIGGRGAGEAAPREVGRGLIEEGPADFGWEEIGTGGVQTRVIKIPVDKFQSGDPRYNIAIRPGDTIYVPVDIIGEFWVMGNVNHQGSINLTGRPMTLKMAIAAAGGLGPLAWPKRCEVIRRLGKDREEVVMVDLDKIFSGEQPDFFVKINDVINVGTHPTARFRAILRNAFRATYGFGFVYDRNFADRDFGTHRPIPDIF
ncbi:MAG TPA: polysaccharide biosynthesis/export family protein [Sedimentisphaerales bacterium]|nr:polysaccharide biosynthesis/export family protein [Sedimentisphaerales bacterium]